MDLLAKFKEQLREYHLLNSTQRVLIAVSGGLDSVVLVDLAHSAEINFCLAHCNFNLRGEESNRDEQFVKTLAANYQVELFLKSFDTKSFAEEYKLSIQEAARKLRYDYFEELRKEHGFSFTLIAHHANDQVETVLMNFFRGTGLEGISGMPVFNKEQAHSLRPLLNVKREAILEYAKYRKLAWVEDSSNESTKYTRNYFRNELLPRLKTIYPAVEDNLLNNVVRFKRTANLYNSLVSDLKSEICLKKKNEVHIPVLKLLKYENTSLLYDIMKDYGFTEKQVEEIAKLVYAHSGKYIANENWQVIKNRRWLILAPLTLPTEIIAIDENSESVPFSGHILNIRQKKTAHIDINNSQLFAQLDATKIEWPLLLRKYRQGDYFYPLGMPKKKKLSRFFIDIKLSKADKENVWVVESNKRIIWVVGYRIDDRFKITDITKQAVELSVSSL